MEQGYDSDSNDESDKDDNNNDNDFVAQTENDLKTFEGHSDDIMNDIYESRYDETNTESEFGNETEQKVEADDEPHEPYD